MLTVTPRVTPTRVTPPPPPSPSPPPHPTPPPPRPRPPLTSPIPHHPPFPSPPTSKRTADHLTSEAVGKTAQGDTVRCYEKWTLRPFDLTALRSLIEPLSLVGPIGCNVPRTSWAVLEISWENRGKWGRGGWGEGWGGGLGLCGGRETERNKGGDRQIRLIDRRTETD